MSFFEQYQFVIESFVAGLFASIACGFGVLPLLVKKIDFEKHIGLGYGFAGGLMFAASVYNLLLPALTIGEEKGNFSMGLSTGPVLQTLIGVLLGCVFLWGVKYFLNQEHEVTRQAESHFGSRMGLLVFIAMFFHSIPEGVAVGVGYASPEHITSLSDLGFYVATAIAIHNIPEGLAVALPLYTKGVSLTRCFFLAVLTSIPQPVAAVPASLLVWLFKPLMLPFFGFAAGAMMYLVVLELIPEALETQSSERIAWAFMLGFSLMVLIQVSF